LRCILVFPDETQVQFMYPEEREIVEGELLQAQLVDGNVHVLQVSSIYKQDDRTYFYLSFPSDAPPPGDLYEVKNQ